MSGVEPDPSEEDSESESVDSDEEMSVDESDESPDSSPGDRAPSCDASVVLRGKSWVGSLFQCTRQYDEVNRLVGHTFVCTLLLSLQVAEVVLPTGYLHLMMFQ